MVRKNEQQALATVDNAPVAAVSDEASALAALDEFDFGGNDGLQEVDSEDLRLPVIVWNMKGKDDKGELRRLDEFYDTLNERSHRQLRCAFIHLHKTNAFVRFDDAKNENVYVCTSYDRVTGKLRVPHPTLGLAEGVERPCDTCPDKQWWKSPEGKNKRNCDTHYGVFGVMLDEALRPTDGFLMRFKRTSLPSFKTHLQKHHIKKRQLPNGKRGNMPLFAFEVTMRLEVSDNGNFATPVIERGRVLPKETLQSLSEQAKFFSEIGDEATRAAEKQETRHERGEGDGGNAPALRGDDFAD
jgi:hypothetical protein